MNRIEKDAYTLDEINKLYNVPVVTLRYWIKKGWLKAQKGQFPFQKNIIYVNKQDWLDFPTFIRDRYKNENKKD
jgi:hypothetical protein